MSVDIRNQGIDPFLRLEAGVIPGFVRYKKFGRGELQLAGSWYTVWDGNTDYPYPTANLASPVIKSSSEGDTQDIVIEGVDENFNYVIMTVTLNGINNVALPEAIMQIFRMENDSADSLTGEVTVQVGATVYGKIKNGANNYNQSQMSIMVVPTGYYGLVSKVGASVAANKSAEVNYRAKEYGKAWKVKRPLDITSQTYVEDVDFFFDEKTILDVRMKPTANNTFVSAWFDITFVRKDVFHRLWDAPRRTRLF